MTAESYCYPIGTINNTILSSATNDSCRPRSLLDDSWVCCGQQLDNLHGCWKTIFAAPVIHANMGQICRHLYGNLQQYTHYFFNDLWEPSPEGS